jgi:hydroxymethylglutaryl-CoA synthase
MADTYDFYKPNLSSEYPEVDGPVSVVTYIQALDEAYKAFKAKTVKAAKKAAHVNGNGHANGNGYANGAAAPAFSLENVDYALFHSPYGKQAIKGHARMLFNDFLSAPTASHFAAIPEAEREAFLAATPKASLTDKNVEKTFVAAGKKSFAAKVDPTMACSRRLGNMYTASLYGCLASLLSTVPSAELKGKRASLFAFGSGCAGSFWTLRIKGDTSEMAQKMDLLNRLKQMKVVPCQEFVDALEVRLRFSSCEALF